MAKFFYFYVLQSHVGPERFNTSLTDDLPMRLKRYNSGHVLHTAKWNLGAGKLTLDFLTISGSAI